MKKRSSAARQRATALKKQAPAEIDPRFVEAFAGDRQVTYGKMFASIGLKVNGRIFAMLAQRRFVVKLPKERVDDLCARAKERTSIQATAG